MIHILFNTDITCNQLGSVISAYGTARQHHLLRRTSLHLNQLDCLKTKSHNSRDKYSGYNIMQSSFEFFSVQICFQVCYNIIGPGSVFLNQELVMGEIRD